MSHDLPARAETAAEPGEGSLTPPGATGHAHLTELDSIYARRFADAEAVRKDQVWREIGRYLQRFVKPGAAVLDLACDRGHFIRHVTAEERWGADMRDVRAHLGPEVRFVQANGLELEDALPHGHFDLIFMSNYLEHLPDSNAVIRQLQVCRTLLKHGGSVLIMQPNIRLVGAAYWDFIDHHVALTDRSLVEAAEIAGLRTERMIVRFLPYTTKRRIPKHPLLVRAYLRFPPAWWVMGKQTLYLATKE